MKSGMRDEWAIARRPKNNDSDGWKLLFSNYSTKWSCGLVTIDHLVGGQRCIVYPTKGVSRESQKESALSVRCPTCGAKPGEKCELSTGLPRTDPHRDRRLAGSESLAICAVAVPSARTILATMASLITAKEKERRIRPRCVSRDHRRRQEDPRGSQEADDLCARG